jgi:hypothetical protein
MKLRFALPVFLLAIACSSAKAQTGLYFNPVVTRVTNGTADTGPFAFLGQNGKGVTFGGVDFGGYYEFFHAPKFDAGIDARDSIRHGNSASLNSFLVSARLVGKPLAHGFKPYVQVAAGAGRTESPLNPVHVTKLEVDGFIGVDKVLNKHVDWRLIEVGYGSVTTVSSALYGGTTPIPAARLLNFSTGFVLRIP